MEIASCTSSSSPELSMTPEADSVGLCQICGKQGHGNHFGAITCRACAAFFRRFGISSSFSMCRKENKCEAAKNGWFGCKQCRLQKCKDIGMTIDNFQFQRDPFHRKKSKLAAKNQNFYENIPQTMDTFFGQSNLIIYTATTSNFGPRRSIDVQFLLNKALDVLGKGAETPFFAESPLEKMALGLQEIRRPRKRIKTFLSKIGREETFLLWESDLMKATKWLTYYDDFQKLPQHLRITMLKGLWVIWSRLEKMAAAAIARRENLCGSTQIVYEFEGKQLLIDAKTVDIDVSWCSRYSFEQLKFFGPTNLERMDQMIHSILDLKPTDVELSYMLCQLCFYHVGKRYQGEILQVCDRFLENLSDNLHEYYTKNSKTFYSVRISHMMRVNNMIRDGMRKRRMKVEMMRFFDCFDVAHSDPEMFVDF